MTIFDPLQSHDLNFKTIIVENTWDAVTFAIPKCVELFKHSPEIVPIREETLKIFFSDSFLRTDAPFLATYEEMAFTFLIEHQHDLYSFSIYNSHATSVILKSNTSVPSFRSCIYRMLRAKARRCQKKQKAFLWANAITILPMKPFV